MPRVEYNVQYKVQYKVQSWLQRQESQLKIPSLMIQFSFVLLFFPIYCKKIRLIWINELLIQQQLRKIVRIYYNKSRNPHYRWLDNQQLTEIGALRGLLIAVHLFVHSLSPRVVTAEQKTTPKTQPQHFQLTIQVQNPSTLIDFR